MAAPSNAQWWTRLTEAAGNDLGLLLAPLFAAGSRLRHARVVHPTGVTFLAFVDVASNLNEREKQLARRLKGTALIRLSATVFKNSPHFKDLLGIALRFGWEEDDGEKVIPARHQDLLLATVRFPWSLPFAPLTTDVEDYLDNDYYAVSPFEIDSFGRARLRVVAQRKGRTRGASGNVTAEDRFDRIRRQVQQGSAEFVLQISSGRRGQRKWRSIARLRLQREIDLDQAKLRFAPFQDAAGFRPVGFIHALRKATYPASQRARQHVAESINDRQ